MVTTNRALAAKHDCRASAEKREATLENPYHFVESGLPDVYLVGIDYYVCEKCRKQSADIPFLKDLMIKIARTVVRQETPLDNNEIRFLRKRLGKKSSEFAKIIGVTPEHLSRLESDSGEYSTSESADKFIRIYYSLLSGDETLKDIMNSHIDAYIASLHGQVRTTRVQAELHHDEWEAESVPA
jgi:DNA-binding transcriptional regulator YiaG